MKIMLRAAIMAVSLGTIGSAHAGDGDGTIANTRFTEVPGVVGQAPMRDAPLVATAQDGQAVQSDLLRSSRAAWVFPPIGNYLAR
jgi:hypothetical protein